ncbi:MAG: hypothetical protein HY722_14345 [Planctomycetes bacterium]|nr:hypothetical protein [Planctomycetota bacterium]
MSERIQDVYFVERDQVILGIYREQARALARAQQVAGTVRTGRIDYYRAVIQWPL